jgi:hypothetical protein
MAQALNPLGNTLHIRQVTSFTGGCLTAIPSWSWLHWVCLQVRAVDACIGQDMYADKNHIATTNASVVLAFAVTFVTTKYNSPAANLYMERPGSWEAEQRNQE